MRAAHERGLLKILLPEYGDIRPHDAEQLCHDRRHAGEMVRAEFSFPAPRDARHRDDGFEPFRIHRRDAGFKADIDPFRPAERAVFGDGARILGEVFRRGELGRVHENADDERIAL